VTLSETGRGKSVRHLILAQMRRNGDDLAIVRRRLDGLAGKLDGSDTSLNSKIDAVARDLTGLRGALLDLADNLPGIVRDALRDVLGDRKK
jgi:hypothetical protein